MSPRIEQQRFRWDDARAREFYDEHGYVIVSEVLSAEERATVQPAWDELVAEAAQAAEMEPDDFVARFPQNRDLWSKSGAFRELLFSSAQGHIARHFLDTSGARLFHDHAIAKPAGRSATIPWHQDSSYWPLDRVGNSLWTPTEAVSAEGGCLKVLAGSHRDGPGKPQDFLSPDGVDRDSDPRLTLLPVEQGESVVLHGLTWHGSSPNTCTVDRLAYLTLWVPSTARFTPSHAGWHPTAAHIDVAPGERLDGDWFPLFGQVADHDDGEAVEFDPPTPGVGPTMFKASESIRRHLQWLAGASNAPMSMLVSAEGAARCVSGALREGLITENQRAQLESVIAELALQERIRERFVARDVYLSTVERWWHLVGYAIEDRLQC
ncbi:MAG: phytanoyl-CoA dioxygenase family protein [Alphaproteobacteria bacterium]|nr:phytanoyl-CoA dioxygenase family protein [Alphaproteobacteria bacterium]